MRVLSHFLPMLFLTGLVSVLALAGSTAQASDAQFWFDALSATEERRHADVIAALKEVDPKVRGPRGALLLALALAAEGEHGRALSALPGDEAMARWPEPVQSDVQARRVHWAARAGRCELLQDVEAKSANLRVAAARCALADAEHARALELLDGLERVDAGELRAQALAESGDEQGALAQVRALWVAHPAHPDADTWRKRLEQAGDFTPTREEHIERAEGWMAARRFNTAVEELSDVKLEGSPRERAALLHLRGTALYRTRNRYDEAASTLARAARLKGATEASDWFHSARAYSRAGNNERAIRDYRRFAKRYPNSRYVADALFLAAWLEARQGRPRAASRALTRLAEHPALDRDPSVREKTLWELGWQARERGLYRVAAKHLGRYGDTARSELEQARGHYWAGVCLARAGQRKQAAERLQKAAHTEPLGYYALLARRKAQALKLADIAPFPNDQLEPGALAKPDVELPPAARFYASLSLNHLAAGAVGDLKGLSTEARVAMLVETHEPEASHRAAHALREPLWSAPPSEDSRWLWRALYPTPFESAVQAQTKATQLPATLLYAHMLVESRFDPSAVSGAGARGLLQLMPATARRVADTLDEASDDQRLLNPAFNIQLGSTYLSRLLAHYEGAFPPAIAAYNAGRANVDRWIREQPGELDVWVERIPIAQTRNYVRRVLSHWARYRYLDEPASWEPPLPERLGESSEG